MVSASTWHVCEVQKPKSSVGNAETGWWHFALLTGTSLQLMSVISVRLELHYSSADLSCYWSRSGKRNSFGCAKVYAGPGSLVLNFPTASSSLSLSRVLRVSWKTDTSSAKLFEMEYLKFRIVDSLIFRRQLRKSVFYSHYYHLINKHRLRNWATHGIKHYQFAWVVG